MEERIKMKSNKLIVVLGMHRSGTSAITRGLKVLGADFGTNLQAAMPGVNDKGFFEDNEVVSINVDVLLTLSHEWHTLSPITRAHLKSESFSELRLRAIELLRKKIQSANVFAIKDPRVARLLPFWQDVFNELGLNVSYVIAIRNPLSVAESLNVRDRIEKEKSCYLWLEHVLPSILETSGNHRVMVDYDNMMEQPGVELTRIAEALELKDELNPDELIKYENKFLDADLRHTKFNINELISDPAVPQVVVDMYQTLVKVATDEWSIEKIEVLNCVQQAAIYLNELAPALSYMARQDWKIAERDGQIAELGGQIVNLIAEHDGQIVNLIAEHDGQMTILQHQENELRHEIEALRLSTSWRLTKPMREVMRLIRFYQSYRQKHPGFNGLKRLVYLYADVNRKKIQSIVDAVVRHYSQHKIGLLHTYLEKKLIINPTILFDHNGGGGSNAYAYELAKMIHADGGTVLRVYCFDAVWYVQWIGKRNEMLFFTPSVEELFEVLSVSHSASIVLNSLYGYPDIKIAVSNIVALTRTLHATLNFKIHDFYALCPSPHLSDLDDKYCGVPKDFGVCKICLKKNLGWYHGWYPKKNRAIDITEWRKPFADLFEAATTVTFFDQSSIEIVRKAFYLEDSKVKVVPHAINYFKCDNQLDVTGPLHIGILGTLSHIKGGDVVKALCEHINEQDLDIPITVVGSSIVDTLPKINVHGSYTPNELPIILSRRGINVILMPSIVPETFSYTISEAMKMGLPIVAFDIGAQGNRVKQYELGKVVPLGSSPEEILKAIQSVLKTTQELKK